MTILRACPFCDSDDIAPADTHPDPAYAHGPGCNACGATAETEESWNKRPHGWIPAEQAPIGEPGWLSNGYWVIESVRQEDGRFLSTVRGVPNVTAPSNCRWWHGAVVPVLPPELDLRRD